MATQKPTSSTMPLIRPEDIFHSLDVQPRCLVVFSPSDWKLVLSLSSVVPLSAKDLPFTSLHTVRANRSICTFAGPALGAPVAAMVVEILAAFGARRIIAVGSCGSLHEELKVGHLIVPEKAFSDEGVSSHYPLRGKLVKPSQAIVQELQSLCEVRRHKWTSGQVWTTEAPFRETPQKIRKFQRKQAIAVEMELSAFFKVCNFYGIEVGALLVVSDELFSFRWNSGYSTKQYRQSLLNATEVAVNVLTK
jgi:uridine phosphorylase